MRCGGGCGGCARPRDIWRGFGGGLHLHAAPELGISLAGEDAMRGADWLNAPHPWGAFLRGQLGGSGGLVKNAHLSRRPSHSPPLVASCSSSRFIALRTASPILLLRPVLRAPIAATGNRARAHPDSHRREENQLACPPNTIPPPPPASSETTRPPYSTQHVCLQGPPPGCAARRAHSLDPVPREAVRSLYVAAFVGAGALREIRTTLTLGSFGRPLSPPSPCLADWLAPPGLHLVARILQLVPRPRPAVWAAPQDHQVEQRRCRQSGRFRPRPGGAPQGLLL